MTRYDSDYINREMRDFAQFRTALRGEGYLFSQESEILLYQVMMRV